MIARLGFGQVVDQREKENAFGAQPSSASLALDGRRPGQHRHTKTMVGNRFDIRGRQATIEPARARHKFEFRHAASQV
jgi:hypothetical protein